MVIRIGLFISILAIGACAGVASDPDTEATQEPLTVPKPARDAGPVDAAPLTAAEALRREMEPVNPAAYYARQQMEPRAPGDECDTIHPH